MLTPQTLAPTNSLADQAAQTADNAIRSTQRAAHHALDGLASGVQDLRHHAEPLLDRAAEQASAVAHRSVNAVRSSAQHVRESALRASDGTVNYIREEPLKAVAIAAAAGAVLMALMGLWTRSGR